MCGPGVTVMVHLCSDGHSHTQVPLHSNVGTLHVVNGSYKPGGSSCTAGGSALGWWVAAVWKFVLISLLSSLQSLLQLDRHTVYSIITNFMSTREEGEGTDARTTLELSRLGECLTFTYSEGSVALRGESWKGCGAEETRLISCCFGGACCPAFTHTPSLCRAEGPGCRLHLRLHPGHGWGERSSQPPGGLPDRA